jgi:hypothetical protein
MRGATDLRVRWIATAAAVLIAVVVGACGDDECNHVITDVPTFEACQQIAVERNCSPEVTYSRANPNSQKPARCKVERCGDCNGGSGTPTVTAVLTPRGTVTPAP